MNKVSIAQFTPSLPTPARPGRLYESTPQNDVVGPGGIYEAVGLESGGGIVLVNLATGSRHDESTWGPSGPAGWRRLPPGTVVTITVEED